MFLAQSLLLAAIGTSFVSTDNVKKLMSAIEKRNIQQVNDLLEIVSVDSIDDHGWNVLHTVSFYPDGEIIRLLMSHGAGKFVNHELKALGESFTPLAVACSFGRDLLGHYEVMEALLAAGGDPNFVSTRSGNTPLHMVSSEREARLLISYGADVNATNNNGCTPAHMCIIRKFYDILYALVDGNADFTIVNTLQDNTNSHLFSEEDANFIPRDFKRLLANNGANIDRNALYYGGRTHFISQ